MNVERVTIQFLPGVVLQREVDYFNGINHFLVLDLDGTISDPLTGITHSLNYALHMFGYPEMDENTVAQYIGPPLDIIMRKITNSDSSELISHIIRHYRDYYNRIGYAENTLYPGIYEGLQYLMAKNIPMGICTSKRVDFAEKILKLFQLDPFFSFISGGDIGIQKTNQLRLLVENKIIDKTAIMIGDRAVDIQAAHENGLKSIGVLWGYGNKEELGEVSPYRILNHPEELKKII
ncbi:HAD family hydrolase [Methanospirillum stamsii]|uniref:HAD family hydrolase n=1 Tax=Methanospirillum stamsii TaxID=1277351 RepID=A0A2V2N280_9EURY|nr:HAD-IA family hydrolase [Methanospirillum stamsii]PWR69561.1 HAD family hydrolase [Methanospirillum stamsii]